MVFSLILHLVVIAGYMYVPATSFLLQGMTGGGYAMYVWRDGYDNRVGCTESEFLQWNEKSTCFTHTWNTADKRQWLWNTCNVPGREVRKIFLEDVHHPLRDGFNSKSCGSGISLLKQTISEGHASMPGRQIYALFAVSDIDVSEKDMVKYVVWYNDHCAAEKERFDGMAVNNEAYAPIKCHQGDADQFRYLQNLNVIKTEASKQVNGRLLTHYSVSWHWGRCENAEKLIMYNGKSQNAVKHMIDIFDSIDVQVGYIVFPQISDRVKIAGYQYALDTGKEIFTTLYTNKGDPCQTTFFPSPCTHGNHTEKGLLNIFDNFSNNGIEQARPCIHYFRGVYSSGGNPDWPRHSV